MPSAAPVNEPQDMYRVGNGCQMGGRGRSLVKALRVVPLWVCGLVGLWRGFGEFPWCAEELLVRRCAAQRGTRGRLHVGVFGPFD
jgi:hypothetical protein